MFFFFKSPWGRAPGGHKEKEMSGNATNWKGQAPGGSWPGRKWLMWSRNLSCFTVIWMEQAWTCQAGSKKQSISSQGSLCNVEITIAFKPGWLNSGFTLGLVFASFYHLSVFFLFNFQFGLSWTCSREKGDHVPGLHQKDNGARAPPCGLVAGEQEALALDLLYGRKKWKEIIFERYKLFLSSVAFSLDHCFFGTTGYIDHKVPSAEKISVQDSHWRLESH